MPKHRRRIVTTKGGWISLDMGNGYKSEGIGEERVVGEGATAGIILAEDITVELPCVLGTGLPGQLRCPKIGDGARGDFHYWLLDK